MAQDLVRHRRDQLDNLGPVLDAGARRVVVVRAITGAADPAAAAGEFIRRLQPSA